MTDTDRPTKGAACEAYASCSNRAETWWTYPSLGRFAVCGFHVALLRAMRGA